MMRELRLKLKLDKKYEKKRNQVSGMGQDK